MIVYDLTFRPSTADAATSFVAALRRSGQCAEPWPAFLQKDGAVRCRLSVPAADALDPRYDSGEVAAARKDVGLIEAARVGPAADTAEACGCRERPFLVLFTTFIDQDTPLRCGGCWGLVPLYRACPERAGDLVSWAATYRYLDGLYMASGVGEGFAYRELSRRDSEFGGRTAGLCRELERAAGLPVYAYLNRVHGPTPAACPDCATAWSRETGAGPWRYRCIPCRSLFPEPTDLREPPPA